LRILSFPDEYVNRHKTGRSKAIYENDVIKGWKKTMVLYKTSQRGEKHDRDNWVMHEYHLGEEEAKKDGELVVSKILYQLANKSTQISKTKTVMNDAPASVINPKTPKIVTPQPHHLKNSPCETEQSILSYRIRYLINLFCNHNDCINSSDILEKVSFLQMSLFYVCVFVEYIGELCIGN
jgi:hypothetical protein